MRTTLDRVKLLFLCVLVIACAAVWAHQVFDVWPRQRCEAMSDWWDSKDHQCGIPMPIWRFTGRPPAAGSKIKPPEIATPPKTAN